jgi:hypothetical protein
MPLDTTAKFEKLFNDDSFIRLFQPSEIPKHKLEESQDPGSLFDGFFESMIEEIEYNINAFERKFTNLQKKTPELLFYIAATGVKKLTPSPGEKFEIINFIAGEKINRPKENTSPVFRVMHNYIVAAYKIYNAINQAFDTEDQEYKQKLLIATLKDKYAQTTSLPKQTRKVIPNNNTSKKVTKSQQSNSSKSLKNKDARKYQRLSSYPNLSRLQVSTCAKENQYPEPFVSYNGAIIFSLTDAQRKILQNFDETLSSGSTEPINISLGVGEGKTFLTELINKIYGFKNHGCHINQKDTAKEINGIYIQDKLVGYSTTSRDGKDEKNIFPSFNYDKKSFPVAKIASLSLKDVSDLDVDQLTAKIQEIIKKLNTSSESGIKIITIDEYIHVPYPIRKIIRKMLPEKEYNLVFISATPNDELINILDPNANEIQERKKNNSYEIQLLQADQNTENVDKNYYGKMPAIIKHCSKAGNERYYVWIHNQNGDRECNEITEYSVKNQLSGIYAQRNRGISNQDLVMEGIKKHFNNHVPLSKSQSLQEDRRTFLNQFVPENKYITVSPCIQSTKKNPIDFLMENISNYSSLNCIQYMLPDITPMEQSILLQNMTAIRAVADRFEIIIYENEKGETRHIKKQNGNHVDHPGLPNNTPTGKVLMLYSSANAIGGDYGNFSRKVDLQIITTNTMPSTSKMQQWTARYRKQYPMNELRDECKVVVNSRANTLQELKNNMVKEQTKDELLDALNFFRNNIVAELGITNKAEQKRIMRLIREGNGNNIFNLTIKPLTHDTKEKIENYIDKYNVLLKRLDSCRTGTEFGALVGNKFTQYSIKLANLLSENEVLNQKKLQLYAANNVHNYNCATFNDNRIKCLEQIGKNINKVVPPQDVGNDNADVLMSKLHTICHSEDAAIKIYSMNAEDVFAGDVSPDILLRFETFKESLWEKQTQLHNWIEQQDPSSWVFFSTQCQLTKDTIAGDIKNAFQQLLVFSDYECFKDKFADLQKGYINALALRHSIEQNLLETEFQKLLKNKQNKQEYFNYVVKIDESAQSLALHAKDIESQSKMQDVVLNLSEQRKILDELKKKQQETDAQNFLTRDLQNLQEKIGEMLNNHNVPTENDLKILLELLDDLKQQEAVLSSNTTIKSVLFDVLQGLYDLINQIPTPSDLHDATEQKIAAELDAFRTSLLELAEKIAKDGCTNEQQQLVSLQKRFEAIKAKVANGEALSQENLEELYALMDSIRKTAADFNDNSVAKEELNKLATNLSTLWIDAKQKLPATNPMIPEIEKLGSGLRNIFNQDLASESPLESKDPEPLTDLIDAIKGQVANVHGGMEDLSEEDFKPLIEGIKNVADGGGILSEEDLQKLLTLIKDMKQKADGLAEGSKEKVAIGSFISQLSDLFASMQQRENSLTVGEPSKTGLADTTALLQGLTNMLNADAAGEAPLTDPKKAGHPDFKKRAEGEEFTTAEKQAANTIFRFLNRALIFRRNLEKKEKQLKTIEETNILLQQEIDSINDKIIKLEKFIRQKDPNSYQIYRANEQIYQVDSARPEQNGLTDSGKIFNRLVKTNELLQQQLDFNADKETQLLKIKKRVGAI